MEPAHFPLLSIRAYLLFDDSILAEPRRDFIRQTWPAGIVDGQGLGQGGVWHKFGDRCKALSKASAAMAAERENGFASKIICLKGGI